MSVVESDGPPSWFLDASETVESTKYPWVGVVEGTPPLPHAFNPITPTHRHYVPLPVSVASRDQDGGQSDSTTDIYDLTENVNSLPPGGFKSQKITLARLACLCSYIEGMADL